MSVDAIRARAAKFAKKFEKVTSEKQHDQNFMRAFCEVFGINPNRIQWQFTLKDGTTSTWADGVLPRHLLFEMKTAGKSMDKAYQQAMDYVSLMRNKDAPEIIVVSDFSNIHVYNQTNGTQEKFKLEDLPEKLDCLLILAGYEQQAIAEQKKINEAAAERIARLHDVMKANGYSGADMETYLVRLLFCLFADDTGLFGEKHNFYRLVENTNEDGTSLHGELERLFNVLNKDVSERPSNLPERFKAFPYVNGDLFAEKLENPYDFDEDSRRILLELCAEDWSNIDPSIFGSLFQAIMHHEGEGAKAKSKKRREFGAHYTSVENILKVINPLFMDGLREEFEKLRYKAKADLVKFQEKLAALNFLDPACGCGNFLVVAYRELRLLELDVIEAIHGKNINKSDVSILVRLNVHQFHGIEIDSTAARIATVAMWLTDHQMNMQLKRLGDYRPRLPLKERPNIEAKNALQIGWEGVIPPSQCSYIVGNPPFIGYSNQSAAQKVDSELVFADMHGAGVLDYVAGWYVKALQYIQNNKGVKVAFVSTNSITQGEQVAVLWRSMLLDSENCQRIYIHFAHRTFRWSNEGRGVAAVHCVIIGFGIEKPNKCRLFEYEDIGGEPVEIDADEINPYLVDAPTIFIDKRRTPLSERTPEMAKGSQPTDGGGLLLSSEEMETILKCDPIASKYIRRFLGAEEFINNIPRYCLWLNESTAQDRKASPEIQKRMGLVKKMRMESPKVPTQKLADVPYLFGEIRQTQNPYLLIPRHSSETRRFIPMGYFTPEVICGDANSMIPDAEVYHFGMLSSTMHNAWIRAVCGRLESRYRYSNTIVYNNYPWPAAIIATQKDSIEKSAQAVLDARELEMMRCEKQNQPCSLATLYAPGNMPAELLKAHQALDKAVDAAYVADGYDKKKTSDVDRVAFLFRRYVALTGSLFDGSDATSEPSGKKKKAASKKAG